MNAPQSAVAMTRAQAEDFLYHEARLLDENRWREWQKLFTADAKYWIPANAADIDPARHVSFVYDDMDLLDERLRRLESGSCFSQLPPSRTLHQVGNVSVEPDGGEMVVRSNLILHEFRNNTQQRFYPMQTFPAHCEHRLRREGGAWKIAFKKVVLLNADGEIADLSFLI